MKKDQHYVCCAYMRGWETSVVSKNEPSKTIEGVYLVDKNGSSRGDGVTVESILFKHHTYTVSMDMSFMFSRCPEIANDFSHEIAEILNQRGVYAIVNGLRIDSEEAINRNITYLSEWAFYYENGNLASKKAILNQIQNLHSYIIEDAFSNESENYWRSNLERFISDINKSDGHSTISMTTVMPVLEMLAYMFIRNPNFDCFNAFQYVRSLLSQAFINSSLGNTEKEEAGVSIELLMRAFWLTLVYDGIFKVEGGVFQVLVKNIADRCQIIVFHIPNIDEGSFITSDTPVFFYRSDVTSKKNNGIYFPLNSQYLMMIGKSSGGGKSIKSIIGLSVPAKHDT